MMQEKYEQAIKETFAELNQIIKERHELAKNPEWKAWELGLDKKYVIESRMKRKGFDVKVKRKRDDTYIVFSHENNLPIHIWREK
jgi:hypothetical protein